MSKPGQIRNAERIARLRDFSGLRYGPCTPSDIDAVLELDDKTFIFIETKHAKGALTVGQRIMYERITDAIATGSRHAVAFIAEHEDVDVIDYARLPVVSARVAHGQWVSPDTPIALRAACSDFIQWCNLGGKGNHPFSGWLAPSRSRHNSPLHTPQSPPHHIPNEPGGLPPPTRDMTHGSN